jgi:subtilisin-like proprotein convertase family protein
MKKTSKLTFFAAAATALFLGAGAQADTTVSYTFVNALIPDGSPIGLTSSTNLTGVPGTISSISVALDITGGFNGDLYAYLAGPGGQIAVLLNRSGLTASSPFGYGDTGFNLTLSDGSVNIHNYQLDASYPSALNGSGQLTGTWAPDARNIDPQSAGTVFDAAPTTADLSAFTAANANTTWTLLIADMSGGGQATLVSWGLTVVTVPEPQAWTLLAGGVGMLLAVNRRRKR